MSSRLINGAVPNYQDLPEDDPIGSVRRVDSDGVNYRLVLKQWLPEKPNGELYPPGQSGSSSSNGNSFEVNITEEFDVDPTGDNDSTAGLIAAGNQLSAAGGTLQGIPVGVLLPGRYVVAPSTFDEVCNSLVPLTQISAYSGIPREWRIRGVCRGRLNNSLTDIAPGGVTIDARFAPAGSGVYPSVFGLAPFVLKPSGGSLTGWNDHRVHFRDMLILTGTDSTLSGIQGSNVARLRTDNVAVLSMLDAGHFIPATHDTVGIYFPQTQNNVFCICNENQIGGYKIGVIGGEHLHFAETTYISGCRMAVRLNPVLHACKGFLSLENNEGFLEYISGSGFGIVNLHIESETGLGDLVLLPNGGIVDAGNRMRGRVEYQITSFPGPTFIDMPVTGAENLNLYNLCVKHTEGGTDPEPSGVLAQWNLSDLTDASGNGNTLTNFNTVTFAAGKVGNGAVLNGTNQRLTSALKVGGSSFSFSLFVKPTSLAVASVLLGEYGNDGASTGYSWLLYVGTDGKANLVVRQDDASSVAISTSDGDISAGAWSCVQGTVNVSLNQLKLRVNAGEWVTDTLTDTFSESTLPFTIGANYDAVGATPGSHFGGMIDCVIVTGPATDGEFDDLYNGGAGVEN